MTEPEKRNITHLGSIRQKQLFNQINALHYQKAPLLFYLRHKNHGHCTYLKADPDPLLDEKATATWIRDETFPATLSVFDLEKIVLNTNHGPYQLTPEDYHIGERAITFTVPENAQKVDFRKQIRFNCIEKSIPITLTQDAIIFTGKLLDFSINGILVELSSEQESSFAWLNHNRPVTLTVKVDKNPVYIGLVTLSLRKRGQYLLIPNQEATPRYNPREYRARRQQLVPSPDLVFNHPITDKKVRLKICDLSSLGFSIEEKSSRASLIPGLLLRNTTISLAGNHLLSCMVQVVYSKFDTKSSGIMRIGCVILDINIRNHLKLINVVQQAQDSSTYISNQIDPEDLFDFFFETGFLYPKKYVEIAGKRNEMMKSYLALYQKGVDINRHFTYQKEGQILGHFSALHVYLKTWSCQHHAALNIQRAGLRVVRAISEYTNDSYKLNPTNIKYIIGYYQESNKFPRRYFGEYVGYLNDPQKTSLDCLSYINEARRFADAPAMLHKGWSLNSAVSMDIIEFNEYYRTIANGLLPDALDLVPEKYADQTLSKIYKSNGLVRQRKLYALRYQNVPKALIDVQSSDFGLNLSEIPNAITIYLIDPSPEHLDMLSFAIHSLALENKKMSDPVMFFPNNFLKICDFHVDKEYTMWTLNVPQGMESYMAWMNRFCR